MRFSTGQSRQARSRSFASLPAVPLKRSAISSRRSVACRRPWAAVEDDVLAGLAQLRLDRVVDGELAGVDDAHVHAALDGVVEEHRVHRLAHRLVAAEREGQVRDAAGDVDMRQGRGDLAASPR